jgi:putative protease
MSVKATEIKDNLLHFPGNSRKTQNNIKISVLYNNISEIFEIPKVDRIYIPFGMFIDGRNGQIIENCHRAGTELYLWLPAITRGNYDALIGRQLSKTIESGIDGVLIGNTSAIEFLKFNQEIKIAGDFSLNIFNSFSAIEWKKLGLSRITLSLEMNMAQLADLKSIPELEKEVVVYGRIPMMTSEYCPVGSILGGFKKDSLCNVACAKGVYSLKDRMGKEFPVWCDKIDCRSTIFNSTVLFMLESMEKFNSSGIDSVRLNITDEKPEEIAELVEAYKDIVLNGKVALSKYDDLIQKIKNKGFTNGHYFRGV